MIKLFFSDAQSGISPNVILRERILRPKDPLICVILLIFFVISVTFFVIPAKAGIQGFAMSSHENGNPEY